ncbi:28966_t:CDS:2, partial [Gigaspora margarita]
TKNADWNMDKFINDHLDITRDVSLIRAIYIYHLCLKAIDVNSLQAVRNTAKTTLIHLNELDKHSFSEKPEKIGKGGFGVIDKVCLEDIKQNVALKSLNHDDEEFY